ncbi:histidine kinase [Allobranchiibius sp. GilTou38]|uniref:sensor histidine kinase n=1 Tax=Allobranchiibius sp. GilTou38 TaxID=2815210 RepID=UPI001AA0D90C|nr:histidine kinase [Allobranchiibius sp. GilTou38]MBO1766162.1 hypothetical protein [Allobranchiibius sp. GilTou38]
MSTADVWGDGGVSPRRVQADLLTAALFVVVCAAAAGTYGASAWATVVVMALALVTRRLSLPLMIGFAVLGAVIQLGRAELVPLADLAYAPLYFTLGADRRAVFRRTGLVGSAVAPVVAGIAAPLMRFGSGTRLGLEPVAVLAIAMSAAVVCGGGWIVGFLRFQGRQRVQARIDARLEESERLRLAEALDQQQERARIAADMHDVVAHSWAVVAAQSDGARYTMKSSPEEAARALEVIGETARSAMADVRTILTELRNREAPGAQLGYGQQEDLFERMRASGMRLQVRETGVRRPSELIALTAYRILSECLTNALKHGDLSRPVLVEQDWSTDYRLRVSNAIRPDAGPPSQTGHGIIGMSERTGLAGGTLTIDHSGGVHRVVAHIPAQQKESR